MLMTTTMMPKVRMLNMPAKLRMTVKTSVDKPKIMASVAAIERRSFQMLMGFRMLCGTYILCAKQLGEWSLNVGLTFSC